MTLVIDTAPLVALADPGDPLRGAVHATLTTEDGPLLVPAPVTAEADYLLGRRFGQAARRAFLSDLVAGRFAVVCLDHADYGVIEEIDAKYADLDLGLVDCAIVAVAARMRTKRLLTFDERHFRAITPLDGEAFVLLPSDA